MRCAISICLVMASAMSGCVEMIPNTVSPEVVHMSHVTQHPPFVSTNENFYVNMAQVTARWEHVGPTFVEISEGYAINKTPEINGPREEFTLKVGYAIRVRP